MYVYVFLCFTVKIIFSRHIILNYSQKINAKFLKLWSYIANSSVIVNHTNNSGGVGRQTATEEMLKCAVCRSLSAKFLGVRKCGNVIHCVNFINS